MSAVLAAVAVTGYGVYQNGKSADKAANNQEKAINNQEKTINTQSEQIRQQNIIARQQLDMAKEDRQYYMDTYRPMEQEIVANAGLTSAEQQEMVTKAGLTTSNAMDTAAAQRERNLQRMGVNPNSGAYADNTRKNAIAKAVAKANTQNSTRTQAKEIDYNQRVAAVGLGKGLTGSAAGLMSNAASNYASGTSAYGQQANIYGQQANAYGNQIGMYGQSAANIANLGMQIGGAALGAQGPNGFDSTKFGNNFIGNYGVQQ